MIQLSIIFITIAFYYECCETERERRERGSGVGGNSKSFPDTCHEGFEHVE